MVLKRLLVTTLGALGLGALAAGPTSAQQVPAPDLFDDQVACSSNVPAGTANAALGMALGMAIKDGEVITDIDGDGVPDAGSDFVGLNYIIPPGNSNCGGGTYSQAEFDAAETALGDGMAGFEVGGPKPVTGPIAKDVAAGYTQTLTAYLAVRAADTAVETAKAALKVLTDAATAGAADTPSITTARETLATAETTQTAANNKLNAVGAGPINMAGIAEWRAKFAVEDAVKAYNMAVAMADTAGSGAQLGDLNYAGYVPLRDETGSYLTNNVIQNGVVNLANLRAYANAEGNRAATQDAMSGAITGEGNFDNAGNLLVPMSDSDDTDGAVITLAPTAVTDTYTDINTRVMAVNDAVTALKKLQKGNKNALLQPAIDEAVRRAELEAAHYGTQLAALRADTTAQNPNAEEDDQYSIADRYSAYTAAKTTRDNAGVTLETAFQARETATSAVAAAFTNPQHFYQQLVDRREYKKTAAEAEVTRLAGLTGDDAATEAQTKAAATAVTAAETALTKATDAQAAFQGLVAEGSPVKGLVEELLKGDAVGDDGGALVDAIAGAYDGQDAAKTRLDALLTEESSTETTDDDGNTVTTTTPESGRIVDIETSIAGLTGEGGDVAVNTAAIAANTTGIGENSDGIMQLDGRVTQNEDDIDSLDGRVTTNEAGIAANTTAIETEATARMEGDAANHTEIMNNRGMIGTNVTNIAANATAIMAEQTARMDADTMLGGRIDTNAGDIMMNAGNIMANEMAIGANAGNISTNADGIAANMNSIGANAASIADNRNMIGELSDDLSVVRAGVAASMALAGMPAINGRGISIGVGSFDGESAFAVGFQIQGEMASFKVGLTSGGGATGASAGVGFQF